MANTNTHISPSRFKNRCFIGLNKVTFYTEEGEILTGDNWLELTDEQARRNMMITFFAPRDLNGEPMDASTVLFEDNDEETDLLQQMKNVALFDMCQAQNAPPNTVNIVLVADVIFHWDNQDNYIQPTSDETWVDDLKEVLQGYPRTTKKYIYTDWEIPSSVDLADAEAHPSTDMPLDHSMWINKPNFQEQYGNHFLIAGVLLAIFAYVGLSFQESQIDAINEQTRDVNAQGNIYRDFSTIKEKVARIEQDNRYIGLFSFTFKDIALAIADIDMALNSYTLQKPNPRKASDVLITRLRVPTEEYPTFEKQEPLAENLLRTSVAIQKMRKPAERSRPETFTLEGLVPLQKLAEKQKNKSGENN